MKKFTLLFLLTITQSLFAQNYTRQDTLRGSITTERIWWDLNKYHLNIKVDPDHKFISGSNVISYTVLSKNQSMQIDLQEPLTINRVLEEGKEIAFEREGNVYHLFLEKAQKIGAKNSIEIYYSGIPREAVRAPWDGGFSWNRDSDEKHFIATSCQGLGASAWWPCKDHMYDEAESMSISVSVPKGLMDVSNGRLTKTQFGKEFDTYTWEVVNPINNYGVNVNIADYTHFSEVYQGEKGALDINYYVLKSDLEKAKKQFKEVPRMLEAFEYWFGPYPFYEDGFKLVQVPYLGMEHQSSVTYGNKFENGYLGRDLSGTGWGLKWDFIIVHESGHEWFANNITYKDNADMWIHEGFTSYSEVLFMDYFWGKQAGHEYILGTRKGIKNDRPIIGDYNVNNSGSGDMYNKGATIIHMIRTMIDDDEKFRSILRKMNTTFYHQTVTTDQIENFIIQESGLDLASFFDQYLRTVQIPKLETSISDATIQYRVSNCIEQFNMPIDLIINSKTYRVTAKPQWQTITLDKPIESVELLSDYYLTTTH